MESINVDKLANAEKIKLIGVYLRFVMPLNTTDSVPLPDDIQIVK